MPVIRTLIRCSCYQCGGYMDHVLQATCLRIQCALDPKVTQESFPIVWKTESHSSAPNFCFSVHLQDSLLSFLGVFPLVSPSSHILISALCRSKIVFLYLPCFTHRWNYLVGSQSHILDFYFQMLPFSILFSASSTSILA